MTDWARHELERQLFPKAAMVDPFSRTGLHPRGSTFVNLVFVSSSAMARFSALSQRAASSPPHSIIQIGIEIGGNAEARPVAHVTKANPHRNGDRSGQFSTAEASTVGHGAKDPKSPHYSPFHLIRDPKPNPKNKGLRLHGLRRTPNQRTGDEVVQHALRPMVHIGVRPVGVAKSRIQVQLVAPGDPRLWRRRGPRIVCVGSALWASGAPVIFDLGMKLRETISKEIAERIPAPPPVPGQPPPPSQPPNRTSR
jgi:hypothetical protein